MVAKRKLYAQLDTLEFELRERIVVHLESAARGENTWVFCTPDFMPNKKHKARVDHETEYLIELGVQILALRKKLNEPSENAIAEHLCDYCREWLLQIDRQHDCAKFIAKDFLDKIKLRLIS